MSTSLTHRIPGLRRKPRSASSAADTPPPLGFEHAKAPSARAAKLTRVGFRCVLGLVAALLLVNVVQNARAANRAAPGPTTAGISADAARLLAATFTADYLSHDPAAAPTSGQDALKRELAPGGDPSRMAFTGTASLSADVVLPGAVTHVDATHAVVAVQARVTIGMPDNEDAVPQQATTTTTPSVPGRSANRSALPAEYQVVATEWLPLAVPVVQTDSGVLVDVAGPVFSADPAPALTAAAESDPTATEQTRGWAKTLFTSYAAGSTTSAYLAAPGVDLAGLAGAVTVADVQTWQLSAPGPNGLRAGQARVGWTFAPTADLSTAQSYTVTVEVDDARWYVTTLGTSATPTN